MALPASGQISFVDVNTELGYGSSSTKNTSKKLLPWASKLSVTL